MKRRCFLLSQGTGSSFLYFSSFFLRLRVTRIEHYKTSQHYSVCYLNQRMKRNYSTQLNSTKGCYTIQHADIGKPRISTILRLLCIHTHNMYIIRYTYRTRGHHLSASSLEIFIHAKPKSPFIILRDFFQKCLNFLFWIFKNVFWKRGCVEAFKAM